MPIKLTLAIFFVVLGMLGAILLVDPKKENTGREKTKRLIFRRIIKVFARLALLAMGFLYIRNVNLNCI